MHTEEFVRGKGHFVETPYVPTSERSTRKFPLILTTGRILAHYNVGAQTRRTDNVAWHPEDLLELHAHDADVRGINDGDLVTITSRVGQTILRAKIAERMPVGVCYTTFHHHHRRQRRHHRELRLGHELPGVQGDRRAGVTPDHGRPAAGSRADRAGGAVSGSPTPPCRPGAGEGGR